MKLINEAQLQQLLDAEEDEHLEFKSVLPENSVIGEYAVALGNEGGGWLLVGVTDRKPRKVVGIEEPKPSDLQRLQTSVLDSTDIRVDIYPVPTSCGYVLAINIPSRPRGQVLHTRTGKYLMRSGGTLRGMTSAQISAILKEAPTTDEKPDLKAFALFEVRKLRYEVEQTRTSWQSLNAVLSKLTPYGRDFDSDIKDEVIYAASLASDAARYDMPADTASRICHVVSESLPITNLIGQSDTKIGDRDKRILVSALGVVFSLAWDGCRYTRNREMVHSASLLFTQILRYAVLNDLSAIEKKGVEIVDRLIALRGAKDELVKLMIFARDDALAYRGQ